VRGERGRSGTAAVLVVSAALAGCSGTGGAQPPRSSSTVPSTRAASSAAPLVSPLQPPPARRPRGTGSWRLSRPARHREIEGYPSAVSALPGAPLSLKVSEAAREFRVFAYRFGAYQGGAAHLVWRSAWLHGGRQTHARMVAPRTLAPSS
jgi:hypothetical protein